jgi:hypothetical protein
MASSATSQTVWLKVATIATTDHESDEYLLAHNQFALSEQEESVLL